MKNITASVIAITVFVAMTGMAQAATVTTVDRVPDAGTTSVLMGIALAGLAVVGRFVR
jgi:hypothetical protein